jgi:hypothetical protein
MAYEWTTGETITAAKLNATGGGLVVQINQAQDGINFVLNKTWLEIYNASLTENVTFIQVEPDGDYNYIKHNALQSIYYYEGAYMLTTADIDYFTNSSNGYPQTNFE